MTVTHDFQSIDEWARYSETPHVNDDQFTCASHKSRPHFTGVVQKADAYRLLREGYPEGCKRMRAILDGLQSNIILETTNDIFTPDVQGCAPNVEAFVQGIPEDMFVISQIEATAPPSYLNVQFELAYLAYITTEQVMLGGAVVFAAMEALRAQGCNVSAMLSFSVESFEGNHHWQCTVPMPNNLDMDTFSFLLSHPSVLRIIVFSIMEHEPSDVRYRHGFQDAGGYSRPHNRRNPKADAYISITGIANDLARMGATIHNIPAAQTLLKQLVDSRFGTVPVNPA